MVALSGTVLVRGVGDVGSAVAHALFLAGAAVALHDVPAPTTPRRGMAFADAAFDGEAELEGVRARRLDRADALAGALAGWAFIALLVTPLEEALLAAPWSALVDARMRKRAAPEDQRALAPLVVGLGPGFVAGGNCHMAVETSWERPGAVVRAGPTLPLFGEPRPIAGVGRERAVYSPVAGTFRTWRKIGDLVTAGEPVAKVGGVPLRAPLAGALRGLVRGGVAVASGSKVVEVDPRGDPALCCGLGERPRRIAKGVTMALDGFAAVRDTFPRPGALR